MRRDEEPRKAVEAAWKALQSRLGALADELGGAPDDWAQAATDAATVGSEVKDLADELAGALSEWLREIPAHDKLDAFLYELASRRKKKVFERAAEASAEMLEFLRQISYGSLPNTGETPNAEALRMALQELLDELGLAT